MSPEVFGLCIGSGVLVFAAGHAFGRAVGRATGHAKGVREERFRNGLILDAKQRHIDLLEAALRASMNTARPDMRQAQTGWRSVLGFAASERVTRENINRAYHHLAKSRHPDRGGSTAAMAALNVARSAALREVPA